MTFFSQEHNRHSPSALPSTPALSKFNINLHGNNDNLVIILRLVQLILLNGNMRYGNPKQSQYHFNDVAQLSSAVLAPSTAGVSFNSGNGHRFKIAALTHNIRVCFLLQIPGTRTLNFPWKIFKN